ncbi:MAG: hypothetical protein IPJ81_02595 [Chitinophagaceae bacterium]|nr:hypothetical protein [Chitinophagaceae bacterium]
MKNNEKPSAVNEEQAYYESAEKARIIESILLSDTEKFKLFTKLMRINIMLRNAKVIHAKIQE